MLKSLAAWALSYRLIVIALALLTAVLGAWAFVNLPVDAYPNIAQTQVKVILKAAGMTPEEVESRVITPIEMEMLGIPGQAILRSSAKYAIADITIDFVDGTDIYWARQQVAERLSGVMGDLPPAVSGGMAPISTPLSDIFMFTIEGPLSLEEKRTLLDWTIRPALRTVPGVADVNALGGYVRTFEVRPDPIALASAGLSIADLQEAIERGNRNDGAGRLSQGEESLIVRAVGAIQSEADLQSMVIATRNGRIVRMGDVATVGTGSLTRYGAVTANGKGEAVQGLVIALRGADARAVVDGVKARVAELEKTLPQGSTIAVFYDRSDLIGRAVGTVEKALIEATILVIILLILFLGDWRAAAIVAATLPMSALVTFLMMRGMGLSANLMSLGGLAIAIGMLVDGAVVVVENIVERLNHAKDDGPPRLHHVYRATGEVVVPVSAGIVIIALVFLPLLSLEGLEGKLFAPVALTIIFALAGSLLIALTLVPVLASLGLKAGHHGEPWIMRKLTPRYRALLDGAFGRKRLVYGLAALGLVLAGLAYGAVGKTFMPSMDEGSVIVQTAKLPTINLDQSVLGDTAVQQSLMKDVPEIAQIIARVGTDEIGLDPMSPNETDSFVVLKPQQEWRGDKAFVVDEIRKSLDKLPGIEPTFTQPIEMRVSEMLTGSRGDLAVKIFGPDLATLSDLAGQVQKILSKTRGASEVMTVANDHVDYLQLDIDRAAAGRDLAADQVEQAFAVGQGGRVGGGGLPGHDGIFRCQRAGYRQIHGAPNVPDPTRRPGHRCRPARRRLHRAPPARRRLRPRPAPPRLRRSDARAGGGARGRARRQHPRAGLRTRRRRRPARPGRGHGCALRATRRAGQQRERVLPDARRRSDRRAMGRAVRIQRARPLLPGPGRGAAPARGRRRDREPGRHLRRAPAGEPHDLLHGQGRQPDADPVAGEGTRAGSAGQRGRARRGDVARRRQARTRESRDAGQHRPQARRRSRRRRRGGALAAAGRALHHRPGDPGRRRPEPEPLSRSYLAWNAACSCGPAKPCGAWPSTA